MKKLTRILALAASLLAFTFIGCNTSVDDATVSGGELRETKSLKIYATSKDDVIYFSESGARTITPAAIDGSSANLEFFLSGKNKLNSDDDFTKTKVTFVANSGDTTEGVVNVDFLNVGDYELTLDVEDKNVTGEGVDKTVLSAKAYADLRYNESIRFFLMPAGTAKGSVDIGIYTVGWKYDDYKTDYKATAYITKSLTDDTPQTGFNDTLAAISADSSTPTKFPQVAGKLDAGTYNFVVEFKDATNNLAFYYSDRIVILPNQTTSATIGIPLVIGKKPEAPANLYVGYVTPEEENSMYYTAEFDWEDKANNEQYFKLELLDITDVKDDDNMANPTDYGYTAGAKYLAAINDVTDRTTDKVDKAWKVLKEKANAPVYVFDNTVYQLRDGTTTGGISYYTDNTNDGSLSKNGSFLGLNLPLGKRYLARLCAVNDAGSSKYTYAIITGGSAPTWTYDSTDRQQWPAKAVAINIFKITYNLVGGDFYDATYPGLALTPKVTSTIVLSDPATIVTEQITESDRTIGKYNINYTNDVIIQYECQSSETTGAGADAKPANAKIINPLRIAYGTSKYAALYKGNNKWTGWKENSTSNSDTYRHTTNVEETLDVYTGTTNLNLYAAYSSATAKIYNPDDYNIKNVTLKLGKTNKYSEASVAFPTNAMIYIKPKTGDNNNYLFIVVPNKDNMYSKIQVQLNETNGTKVATYKSAGTTTAGGTTTYTEETTKPGAYDDYKDKYAKDSTGTTFTDESDWNSATKWYKIGSTGGVTSEIFVIETTSVKTTSFQATVQAYAGINTKTPYTYPVIFTIAEEEL